MLFLQPPANADDIRAFCRQFNEGLRVEYKGTFDANVRSKTAKMVSSLANTLGGVAIMGVNTENGVPVLPIDGFGVPTEELTLVIEQICLQGVNPPIIPKITQVPSDAEGKCFLVIEVDESPEAPHAIENQRKVYVRTGNAANPYELAEVDLIIERFTRRQNLQKRHIEMVQRQRERAKEHDAMNTLDMTIEVSVGPIFPRNPLVARQAVWDFAFNQIYRGGHFIPSQLIRRTNDGVAGMNEQSREYLDLTEYGFVFCNAVVDGKQLRPADPLSYYRVFNVVYRSILRTLVCSSRYFNAHQYRGSVEMYVKLSNCFRQSLPFLPRFGTDVNLDDFRSVERTVTAQTVGDAETLGGSRDAIMNRLLTQLCWSFWQPLEEFPQASLEAYIAKVTGEMGTL